jgi:hypothetical protein
VSVRHRTCRPGRLASGCRRVGLFRRKRTLPSVFGRCQARLVRRIDCRWRARSSVVCGDMIRIRWVQMRCWFGGFGAPRTARTSRTVSRARSSGYRSAPRRSWPGRGASACTGCICVVGAERIGYTEFRRQAVAGRVCASPRTCCTLDARGSGWRSRSVSANELPLPANAGFANPFSPKSVDFDLPAATAATQRHCSAVADGSQLQSEAHHDCGAIRRWCQHTDFVCTEVAIQPSQ